MKRRTTKAVATLSASAALVLGLSACSTDESTRKAGIDELAARGFEEVKYVKDVGKSYNSPLYTAKLDECRIDIVRDGSTGQLILAHTAPSTAKEMSEAIRKKAGGPVSDIVNPSFLRDYAKEVGLQHCLKG